MPFHIEGQQNHILQLHNLHKLDVQSATNIQWSKAKNVVPNFNNLKTIQVENIAKIVHNHNQKP
jgi:hypothetical protein